MKKILLIYKPAKLFGYSFEKKFMLDKAGTPIGRFIKHAHSKMNPRTLDYFVPHLDEIELLKNRNECELHLVTLFNQPGEMFKEEFSSVQVASNESEFLRFVRDSSKDPDEIVCLYSDSIGQGCGDYEKLLIGKNNLFVFNGRRRFFRIEKNIYKKLRFRRLLEKYFILELFTSVTFPLITLVYFLYDLLTFRIFRIYDPAKSSKIKKTYLNNTNDDGETNINDIKKYWSERPQTYGSDDGKPVYLDNDNKTITLDMGDKKFYDKVDEIFYSWNKPLHETKDGQLVPFGKIYKYDDYVNKNVLEIGCGMGTMAMNWAKRGVNFTAVDLSPTSIAQSKKRFSIYNLEGHIEQADSRALPFEDNNFDYVYSWGVLHHSPNIITSLREVYRVLKPGGKTGIMLYSRQSLYYYYLIQYLEGFLHAENLFIPPVELTSRYSDGAAEEGNPFTYPVTYAELTKLIMPQFKNLKIKVFGTELDGVFQFLCIPYGKFIPRFLKKSFARRYGWSIWIEGEKK